jgi:hypothetical protein
MMPHDKPPPPRPAGPAARTTPPKLFECKLCGKVFDSDEPAPACPECDSYEVEQMG